MARDRANIFTSIWTDTDWRALTRDQQWLYELLMTHPELNYAGVCDWRPGRLAKMSADTSRAQIERIGTDLQARRFILIDEDTEEVLVRSWIRHDGLLKHPKTCISFVNAYGATSSPDIRRVIIHELKRLHAEDPTLKAFEFDKVLALLRQPSAPIEDVTLGSTPPLPLPDEQAQPSPQPITQPLDYGLGQPLTQPPAQPVPTATATTTATSTSKERAPDKPAPALTEVPRADVQAVIDHMTAALTANDVRRFKVTKGWHDAARLLIDKDGYTVEQIQWITTWATRDNFWKSNILSIPKLREKFETLKLQSTSNRNATRQDEQLARGAAHIAELQHTTIDMTDPWEVEARA